MRFRRMRAIRDMRADDIANFAGLEASIREQILKHLIPDTSVDVRFQRLYPAVSLRKQSLPIAEYARGIYGEYGGTLAVATKSPGVGTDAAFAARIRTRTSTLSSHRSSPACIYRRASSSTFP